MQKFKIKEVSILSDNWYVLKKVDFDYQEKDGSWVPQSREAYDRGNGATILLYNEEKKTVILTEQLRIPTVLNGNPTGLLIETAAGLLDEDNPLECIKRETEEETGYKLENVEKVFDVYMSPGSVTEILYFFIGQYDDTMKVSDGGGVSGEEDIKVLELSFEDAYGMIFSGKIKDAKTIMLLQHLKIHNPTFSS